ncbi:sensor domain-containing protein [Mycobacterium sp. CBMA271]|uniref:sensor domain-containing protein n=1 Tax=unclassified Mycobacteroides TaxID=2618759 RepID=UPI0012DEB143|nr:MULTISPECIES: sensor domain-containing protein [unclassified Mycobacteroides]MUM19002.1 hypothetical protein [Mycobacteroides sp. CBMA 326]MUM22821.1 sensor domain-containing protein [Mycobacteroides sp. CBMA 271]
MKHAGAALLAVVMAIMLATPAGATSPEAISKIFLSTDETATLLNAPLTLETPFDSPYQDFNIDVAACHDAVDIGLPSVFETASLQAFHISLMRDVPVNGRYFIKQAAGIFADAAAAKAVFTGLGGALAACYRTPGAVEMTFPGGGAPEHWRFQDLAGGGTDRLTWRKKETVDIGWECTFGAQLKGNVVLQAKTCEYSYPGAHSTALLNAMLARTPS